jgi:hypothetical protein
VVWSVGDKKTSCPCQDSNPGSSSLQRSHYTDYTIVALHVTCVKNTMYPIGSFQAHCHFAQRLSNVSDLKSGEQSDAPFLHLM